MRQERERGEGGVFSTYYGKIIIDLFFYCFDESAVELGIRLELLDLLGCEVLLLDHVDHAQDLCGRAHGEDLHPRRYDPGRGPDDVDQLRHVGLDGRNDLYA